MTISINKQGSEPPVNFETVESIQKEDQEKVLEGLKEYNATYITPELHGNLAVFVRYKSGEIYGGIIAQKRELWLSIKYLWVEEMMRSRKTGSQLIERLEQEAKVRGCKKVLVDTLSFQALPFYQKHGYTVCLTLDDYPAEGQQRYYLTKSL